MRWDTRIRSQGDKNPASRSVGFSSLGWCWWLWRSCWGWTAAALCTSDRDKALAWCSVWLCMPCLLKNERFALHVNDKKSVQPWVPTGLFCELLWESQEFQPYSLLWLIFPSEFIFLLVVASMFFGFFFLMRCLAASIRTCRCRVCEGGRGSPEQHTRQLGMKKIPKNGELFPVLLTTPHLPYFLRCLMISCKLNTNFRW